MKATVILCDPEERRLVDIDGRDRRAFEKARERLGLPRGPIKAVAEEAPELYVSFLAWNSLRRTGVMEAVTFEQFEDRLVEVIDITQDKELDPTKASQ